DFPSQALQKSCSRMGMPPSLNVLHPASRRIILARVVIQSPYDWKMAPMLFVPDPEDFRLIYNGAALKLIPLGVDPKNQGQKKKKARSRPFWNWAVKITMIQKLQRLNVRRNHNAAKIFSRACLRKRNSKHWAW